MFNRVGPVNFYPSDFISRIHWRRLNYSKAAQPSPVLLPGVYWCCAAEMAGGNGLSDCVRVQRQQGNGLRCEMSACPLNPPVPTASVRAMHEVRSDKVLS